jgi:urease accessory protein
MDRDARRMRGDGPTLFTSVRKDEGVDGVVDLVLAAWKGAGMPGTAGAVGNDEE